MSQPILVWLLVVMGQTVGLPGRSPSVLERFQDLAECQRVISVIQDSSTNGQPVMRCIQAKVYVP